MKQGELKLQKHHVANICGSRDSFSSNLVKRNL